jgi:hypothetical protein
MGLNSYAGQDLNMLEQKGRLLAWIGDQVRLEL